MKLDLAAVFAVFVRLDGLHCNPPLFNDRMTPAIIDRRYWRIVRWMGPYTRYHLADYYQRLEKPPAGKYFIARHVKDKTC